VVNRLRDFCYAQAVPKLVSVTLGSGVIRLLKGSHPFTSRNDESKVYES
jgi:hypothetical protein